jgi:hypothetical protein
MTCFGLLKQERHLAEVDIIKSRYAGDHLRILAIVLNERAFSGTSEGCIVARSIPITFEAVFFLARMREHLMFRN